MPTATFSGTYTANNGEDYAAGTVTITPFGGTPVVRTLDATGSYSATPTLVLSSSTGLWLNRDGEVVTSRPGSGSLLIAPGTAITRAKVRVEEAITGAPPKSYVLEVTDGQTVDTSRDVGTVLGGAAAGIGVDIEAVKSALSGTYVKWVNMSTAPGVVADGIANDSAAIAAAIAAAPDGTVFHFPGGRPDGTVPTYHGVKILLNGRHNLTFLGDGGRSSVLKRFAVAPPDHGPVFELHDCTGITFTGLAYDANAVPSYCGMASVYQSQNVRVIGNEFFDSAPIAPPGFDRYAFVFGQEPTQNKDVWFCDNRVEGLQVEVDHCKRAHIKDNIIIGAADSCAIAIVGIAGNSRMEDYEVSGNIIENPTVGIGLWNETTARDSGVHRRIFIHDNIVFWSATTAGAARAFIVGNRTGVAGAAPGATYRQICIDDNLIVCEDGATPPVTDAAVRFVQATADLNLFDDCHIRRNTFYRASNTRPIDVSKFGNGSIVDNRSDGIPHGINVNAPIEVSVTGNSLRGTSAGGSVGISLGGTSGGKNIVSGNEVNDFTTPISGTFAATDAVVNIVNGLMHIGNQSLGLVVGDVSAAMHAFGSGVGFDLYADGAARMSAFNFHNRSTSASAGLSMQWLLNTTTGAVKRGSVLSVQKEGTWDATAANQNAVAIIRTIVAGTEADTARFRLHELELLVAGKGIIAKSPDGTAYRLVPPNGGGAATWVAA